jgi:hypothetical protein
VLELVLAITADPSMQQRFCEFFIRFIFAVECVSEVVSGISRFL